MSLHRLLFDTANPAESANVGAFLRAGTDGDQISSTNVSGKEGLDVNIINSLTISATDLDIRDLSHTQDSIKIGDGTDFLAIAADGSIAVTDNGASLTVDAVDLDIRNLTFAADKVDVTGSSVGITGTVAVTQSTSPWVVSATDLDIRDLAAATDSVAAWMKDGAGTALTSTLQGGKQALDVYVANTIDVDDGLANTALSAAAESVAASGALVTSVLSNRKYISIYNHGNKEVYIGASGVSSANGFPIFPGSLLEARIGAAVAIHAVSASGTQDIRILQAS